VNYGYRAFLIAYEKGDGAIVMSNSDNGETLIQAIVRTIAFDYGWPDYAPTTRILNATDPKAFDRNIGAYRLPSGGIVTFWRDGIHIEVHQSGQPVFEIFPTSELEYFYKTVDARWVFSSDLLHATLFQNDQEQTAKRLDDPDGKLAVEFSIAEQRRFKDQKAAAESAAALRRLITGLASGTPNYDEMAPAYAAINRQQLPMLKASLEKLGPIQSIDFIRVGAAAQDVYIVKFEHGDREFSILLESDGRVHAAQFSP
jgi:hypothetical protein